MQRKDASSAVKEREQRAIDDLIGIVERYFINNQPLSRPSIQNHIQACERNHKANLSENCSPLSVLQDVAFRIQKSPHINDDQRTQQVQKIEEMIDIIDSDSFSRIIDSELEIISELVIEHPKNEEIKKLLDSIKNKSRSVFQYGKNERQDKWIKTSSIFAGMGISAALLGSLQYFVNSENKETLVKQYILAEQYRTELDKQRKIQEDYEIRIKDTSNKLANYNKKMKSVLENLEDTESYSQELSDINIELKAKMKDLITERMQKTQESNKLRLKLNTLQSEL